MWQELWSLAFTEMEVSCRRRQLPSKYILNRSSQPFRHTPGLRNAAPWRMRGIAIENLGHLPQAHVVQMRAKSSDPCQGLFTRRGRSPMDFHIRGNERAHELGPDRALVVGAVPASGITLAAPAILRVVWREAA
jgi:hypothetical protein